MLFFFFHFLIVYLFLFKLNPCNFILQDIFSSGIIKSATDFQVYQEVAGLSGLDFAYTDNTAVYHTKVFLCINKSLNISIMLLIDHMKIQALFKFNLPYLDFNFGCT